MKQIKVNNFFPPLEPEYVRDVLICCHQKAQGMRYTFPVSYQTGIFSEIMAALYSVEEDYIKTLAWSKHWTEDSCRLPTSANNNWYVDLSDYVVKYYADRNAGLTPEQRDEIVDFASNTLYPMAYTFYNRYLELYYATNPFKEN